jgi:hypothetical protein
MPDADTDEYEDYGYGYDDADEADHHEAADHHDVHAARLARRTVTPEEYDHEEDGHGEDKEEADEEHPHHNALNRRAYHGINIKQYKWWQYQTKKGFMDMVVGNPNIRNLNFRDQSRQLGMGLRRRDVGAGAGAGTGSSTGTLKTQRTYKKQLPYPMARPLVPTRFRDPVGRGRGGFGPMPDEEDGKYYY